MITKSSSALAAALALALATGATTASADSLRIQVGDVSTPAGAHALQHRINLAAARLCEPSYALVDLGGWQACLSSVRQEALQQLSPAEQQAYAASLRAPVALASR
ncbi:MAG TPA: UrcA family protein [Caulobacteraceae bacterium]|jgi:UrcA family protein|nr:UrcA family protein [Caulobacteraceae bacterium]